MKNSTSEDSINIRQAKMSEAHVKNSKTKSEKKVWSDNARMHRERAAANNQPLILCPWCKHKAGENGPEVTGTHPGTDWVECNNCGAKGPGQKNYRLKGASERARVSWNSAGESYE